MRADGRSRLDGGTGWYHLSPVMYRINVGFSQIQLTALREEAGRTGIPVAELIRRIIDRYFEREHRYGATPGAPSAQLLDDVA